MARMRSWTVAADGAGGEDQWRRANGDWVLAITHRNRQGWRVRTFQDISEMKRIEAATAETARLLQLTLDSMGCGLTMYDRNWNLVVRNDCYRQHFDLPPDQYWNMATFDELVGATMRQDYGGDWRQRLSVVRDPARMVETLAANLSPPRRPGDRFAEPAGAGWRFRCHQH